MIDDGAALSVAIETAVHGAPSITADMDPWFGIAGPVVSRSHAQSVTNAVIASIDDRFRMQTPTLSATRLTERSRLPSHG